MAAQGETYVEAFPPKPKPYISYGLTFEKACAHHAESTFHASRIYVVVSRSISKTEAFTTLQNALGDKIVGVRYGILPHTPWEDVLDLVNDLKTKNPDLIVTLGAGSISDGVKLARLLAANDVTSMSGADALYAKCPADLTNLNNTSPDVKAATIPVIFIPTTLSGGEFTPAGAATNMETFEKRNLMHASMLADLVVFDPALTVSTPARFWLSTGMRGVDHCVEGLYANLPNASVETSAELVLALRGLLVGLLKTKMRWDDLEARLQSQLAVRTAIKAIHNGMGASHGIGHQLGPLGVGHGETSCIILPAVMKYNWAHGDEKVRASLRQVASAFWDEPVVVEALGLKVADREARDPGDLVAAFVKALGLPSSMGQFGIGEDKYESLAENSMRDPCVHVNSVKLDTGKIVEILKMAA
ncbi:Dehydroquinate synthase-like protein [Annulohypoxylon maeteangense]|uniref:Dehydroquinate synthase-like protein n=1 Tax=Annulohypoxylon maeteangense TaxID=1927788 RepID=UPI00200866A4|nr:Dehydroquinate synthase-like protein [Annulohypoxylon maeteangense]KAI0888372.1 Dehydroquinate synthase-like protein [Annulohypoxylon maeteangense]